AAAALRRPRTALRSRLRRAPRAPPARLVAPARRHRAALPGHPGAGRRAPPGAGGPPKAARPPPHALPPRGGPVPPHGPARRGARRPRWAGARPEGHDVQPLAEAPAGGELAGHQRAVPVRAARPRRPPGDAPLVLGGRVHVRPHERYGRRAGGRGGGYARAERRRRPLLRDPPRRAGDLPERAGRPEPDPTPGPGRGGGVLGRRGLQARRARSPRVAGPDGLGLYRPPPVVHLQALAG